MKKIKRLLVVAALGLIIGATAKVQTQAAVTGVKQIDDSKNSVKLQCNAILGAGYYYLELITGIGLLWMYLRIHLHYLQALLLQERHTMPA